MANSVSVAIYLLFLVSIVKARSGNPLKTNLALPGNEHLDHDSWSDEDAAILDELAQDIETSRTDVDNDVSVQTEVLATLRSVQEELSIVRTQLASLKLENQLIYKTVRRRQKCKPDRGYRADEMAADGTVAVDAPRQPICRREYFYSPDYNMCYHFGTERMTWRMARERCGLVGGDLVTVSSSKHQNFLNQHASKSPDTRHCDFWIGLKDEDRNRNWIWVANGQEATYKNWNHNEPNNSGGNEYCVHSMWVFNWAWNDATCNQDTSCYICQMLPRQ